MIAYIGCFVIGMLAGAYVVIAWALSAAQKRHREDGEDDGDGEV